VSRSVDGLPLAGVNIDVTDFQGTHVATVTSSTTTAGVDKSPANFSIGSLGPGTYTLKVDGGQGVTLPTLPTTITLPATGGLRQNVVVAPNHTFVTGLQMFSVPDDYLGDSSANLLAGLGASGRIATWDALNFTYAVSPTVPANTLSRGRSYWARPAGVMGLYGAHTPADSSVPFVLPLVAGWNMIADPFNVPVNIVDFRSGSVASPAPAAQLISLTLYQYNPTSGRYVQATDSLSPYDGCWVYALKNGNLIVYPAQ